LSRRSPLWLMAGLALCMIPSSSGLLHFRWISGGTGSNQRIGTSPESVKRRSCRRLGGSPIILGYVGGRGFSDLLLIEHGSPGRCTGTCISCQMVEHFFFRSTALNWPRFASTETIIFLIRTYRHWSIHQQYLRSIDECCMQKNIRRIRGTFHWIDIKRTLYSISRTSWTQNAPLVLALVYGWSDGQTNFQINLVSSWVFNGWFCLKLLLIENKFDCAFVCLVYSHLFLSCFFALTQRQRDMEVLACSRLGFSLYLWMRSKFLTSYCPWDELFDVMRQVTISGPIRFLSISFGFMVKRHRNVYT